MAKDIFGNPELPNLFGNSKLENKREPISKSQKNEVLAKQKNHCANCKKMLDMRAIHFDHIKEVYKGGKSQVSNLQALCANCHNIKTHQDRLKKVETKRRTANKSNTTNILGFGNKKKGNSLFEIDF